MRSGSTWRCVARCVRACALQCVWARGEGGDGLAVATANCHVRRTGRSGVEVRQVVHLRAAQRLRGGAGGSTLPGGTALCWRVVARALGGLTDPALCDRERAARASLAIRNDRDRAVVRRLRTSHMNECKAQSHTVACTLCNRTQPSGRQPFGPSLARTERRTVVRGTAHDRSNSRQADARQGCRRHR